MAIFNRKTEVEAAPFKERRVRGKVVSFSAEIVAEAVPSPAHALQQMLVQRAVDNGYITDPAARRVALAKFVGMAMLLWGGSAVGLVSLMLLAH